MSHTFPLSQPWLAAPEPLFQAGEMKICCTGDQLVFTARLADRSVFSRSSQDGQPLHLLGDTLEIFFRATESQSYWEFHISPNNHRASLHWPLGGIGKVRAGTANLDDFRVSPERFQSSVEIGPPGWAVRAVFRLEEFDLAAAEGIYFSVCRYDFDEERSSLALSSTSAHPVANFHRADEWRWFAF